MITETELPPLQGGTTPRQMVELQTEEIKRAVSDAACTDDGDDLDCDPVILPPTSLNRHHR